VNIVSLTLNSIGILAKGIRKEFAVDLRELTPIVFEKLKEKKGKVLMSCFSTMDTLLKYTLSMEDILENLRGILPSSDIKESKENCCILIERSLVKTNISIVKKICKPLAEMLVKTSEDKSGDVRDASLKALGVLLVRVGENQISKCNYKYLNK